MNEKSPVRGTASSSGVPDGRRVRLDDPSEDIGVHLRFSSEDIGVHLRFSSEDIGVHLRFSSEYIGVHLRFSRAPSGMPRALMPSDRNTCAISCGERF